MTTRILPSFNLFTPTTIEEAISLVGRYRRRAKVVAGGTDSLVSMKKGDLSAQSLIKIGRIQGLSFIRYNNRKGLSLGPLTTILEIEKSKAIKENYLLLAEAARVFGTVQIQNMATVGGNICNASPAGDMIIPLLAMDAEVDVIGIGGRRTIELKKFFLVPGRTAMKANEILVEIRAKPLARNAGSSFIKIGRTSEDLAKASVAAVVCIKKNEFEDVRLALGAVAAKPVRASTAERFLKAKAVSSQVIDEAASLASSGTKPITDTRSTGEYRREITRVLVKRAIGKALERVEKK